MRKLKTNKKIKIKQRIQLTKIKPSTSWLYFNDLQKDETKLKIIMQKNIKKKI